MSYIGIDIGTTSLSCTAIDDKGVRLFTKTVPNTCHIPAKNSWEKLQDADGIVEICRDLLKEAKDACGSFDAIGIDGQMHGIVYVSASGKAVSPLISWQDGRGDREYEKGKTYCDLAYEKCGEILSTGYGLMTVFCDTVCGNIPQDAAKICTIGDYAAMALCGGSVPFIHPSNAASLGLFDKENLCFDLEKVRKLGIDETLLPEVLGEEKIGKTPDGELMAVAIGDNQASVLGSLGIKSGVLLNIGTGSQISAVSDRYENLPGLDTRPYFDGKYLINGSALCGGYAYKILENFFKDTLFLFGAPAPENMMAIMDKAAQKALSENTLENLSIDTSFRGSRQDPSKRGVISSLSEKNFTPGAISYGFLEGITKELYDYFVQFPENLKNISSVAASGNGVRKSEIQKEIIKEMFACQVKIPLYSEEASYGAALEAMAVCGGKSWDEIQKMIKFI